MRIQCKVSAVADKNAGLVKIDRKSVEYEMSHHLLLFLLPVFQPIRCPTVYLKNRNGNEATMPFY